MPGYEGDPPRDIPPGEIVKIADGIIQSGVAAERERILGLIRYTISDMARFGEQPTRMFALIGAIGAGFSREDLEELDRA